MFHFPTKLLQNITIFVHSEDTNVSRKFYTPTHSRCMLNIPVCTEFLPNRPHHESMGYGKRY